MSPLAPLLLALAASAQVQSAPPSAPRPPDFPASVWFSNDDYPAAALRAEEEGRATYRIEIGADGRVSGCAITGSSGSAALDAATCRILRSRGRFNPARDSRGHPAPDARDGWIDWVLSDEPPPPPPPPEPEPVTPYPGLPLPYAPAPAPGGEPGAEPQ